MNESERMSRVFDYFLDSSSCNVQWYGQKRRFSTENNMAETGVLNLNRGRVGARYVNKRTHEYNVTLYTFSSYNVTTSTQHYCAQANPTNLIYLHTH